MGKILNYKILPIPLIPLIQEGVPISNSSNQGSSNPPFQQAGSIQTQNPSTKNQEPIITALLETISYHDQQKTQSCLDQIHCLVNLNQSYCSLSLPKLTNLYKTTSDSNSKIHQVVEIQTLHMKIEGNYTFPDGNKIFHISPQIPTEGNEITAIDIPQQIFLLKISSENSIIASSPNTNSSNQNSQSIPIPQTNCSQFQSFSSQPQNSIISAKLEIIQKVDQTLIEKKEQVIQTLLDTVKSTLQLNITQLVNKSEFKKYAKNNQKQLIETQTLYLEIHGNYTFSDGKKNFTFTPSYPNMNGIATLEIPPLIQLISTNKDEKSSLSQGELHQNSNPQVISLSNPTIEAHNIQSPNPSIAASNIQSPNPSHSNQEQILNARIETRTYKDDQLINTNSTPVKFTFDPNDFTCLLSISQLINHLQKVEENSTIHHIFEIQTLFIDFLENYANSDGNKTIQCSPEIPTEANDTTNLDISMKIQIIELNDQSNIQMK